MNELTNQKWYTSKEMCEMNNVSIETLKNFNEVCSSLIKRGGYHNRQNLYSEDQANEFKYWLQKNQASQGRGAKMIKYEVNGMVDENNKYKYSKEDICNMCNVDEKTFRRFRMDIAVQAKSLGRSHKEYFTEEALKQFQLWLMKNQTNQGRASNTIKQATTENTELGALATCVQNTGDVAAARKLAELLISNTEAVAECKRLEAQNTQLIEENKEIRAIAEGHNELRQNAVASKTEALIKATKLDYRLKKEQCKMTLKEFAGALQTTPEKLLQFLKKFGYIYEDGNICGKRNKNGNGEVLYKRQDGCYFFNQEFLKRFRKN